MVPLYFMYHPSVIVAKYIDYIVTKYKQIATVLVLSLH